MGSKARIAKYIVPIIQNKLQEHNLKLYVEPFVGGGNVIDKIEADKKIGCDNQYYLIELFKNIEKVYTLPEFVTKEHYSDVRCQYNNGGKKYDDWYVGMIGFLASYNGRFFDGGYAGIATTKNGTMRNYYDEARRNLVKQSKNLSGIEWIYGDYRQTCSEIRNALIYCDIPYKDTKQYSTSKNFNYDEFWEWAEKMSENNIVLVSEYQAPENWECIWSKPLKKSLNYRNHIESVEKLFELKRC